MEKLIKERFNHSLLRNRASGKYLVFYCIHNLNDTFTRKYRRWHDLHSLMLDCL